MEHPSHQHSLILNENYIAREGDVCRACDEQIVSCKSSVYSCSRSSITDDTTDDRHSGIMRDYLLNLYSSVKNVSCAEFLLHKSCAELPAYIQNPTNPKEFLKLCFNYSRDVVASFLTWNYPVCSCNVCCISIPPPWELKQFFYCNSDTNTYVCLRCALIQFQQSLEDRKFEHPAHSQHPLALIQRPSSFKCDACKVDDNNKDSSYRCTKCQFWMHKSCGDAPTTFQFRIHHQHPLVLSFSLPRVYYKFKQYCRLCKETLKRLDWIYYCRYCRFFAHFQCARSSQMLSIPSSSKNEIDNLDVVHLPAADESSAILLGKQFVKEMSTLYKNKNMFSSTNSIKHWAHAKHHLQLMTTDKLNNQKDNDKILLICDGCIKPIQTDDDHQFYGCAPCKYFLHTFCAELPEMIEHYPSPDGMTIFARYFEEKPDFWSCDGCGLLGNGIFFGEGDFNLHIGCVALPKMIKHEGHIHKLNQVLKRPLRNCQACGRPDEHGCYHWCEQCDYSICNGCIMMSRTVNHRWDPHPLHLIYDPGMVIDHEHDFNCEFCSEDIDTNLWFYHCTDCDLSFHLDTCYQRSCHQEYSNVKFGATGILEGYHPHSLTFVLNKKVRNCAECDEGQLGMPVFECDAPCKAVFCKNCACF